MPSLQAPAPTFDDVWRTIQELALQSKETDRIVKNLSKSLGELGNRLGEFVQEMRTGENRGQTTVSGQIFAGRKGPNVFKGPGLI